MEPLLLFLGIYAVGFVVSPDSPRRTWPISAAALIAGFLLSQHVTALLTPAQLDAVRPLAAATAGTLGLMMGLRLPDAEPYDRGIDFLDTLVFAVVVLVTGGVFFVASSLWHGRLLELEIGAAITLFVAARARPFDRRFGDVAWLFALLAAALLLWRPSALGVQLPVLALALAAILALTAVLMLGRAPKPATATLVIAAVTLFGCALGPHVGAPSVLVLFLVGALCRGLPGLQPIRAALREVERPTNFALLVIVAAGLELEWSALALGVALSFAAIGGIVAFAFIRGTDGLASERFLVSPFAFVLAAAVAEAHGAVTGLTATVPPEDGPPRSALATTIPLAFALAFAVLDAAASAAVALARWRTARAPGGAPGAAPGVPGSTTRARSAGETQGLP